MKRILLILIAALDIYGAALTLNDTSLERLHEGNIAYIRDEPGTLKIDDVVHSDAWTVVTDTKVGFGFDAAPYWYRIKIDNASHYQAWLLQFEQATIDYLDIYCYEDEKQVDHVQMGDHLYMDARIIKHPTFLYPFTIEKGGSLVFYFKVVSPIQQLGLKIWEAQKFEQSDFINQFFLSTFFGIIFVIFAFNLAFLLMEKESESFKFFTLYLIALGSMQFSKSGLYHFFEVTPMWFNTHIQYFSAVAFIFLFTQFLRVFLETGRYMPKVDRLMKILMGVMITLYLSQFVVPLTTALQLSFISALPIMGLLIYFSMTSWNRGLSYRIMIFAWISFAVATLALAMSKMGLVERNFFTEHSFNLGIIVDTILMSFALSNKIKEERDQRIVEQLQENQRLDALVEQKTRQLVKANQSLDKKVKQRTEELEQLNASLQERIALAVLDMQKTERMMVQQSKMAAMGEMIEVIAHQWRQPLNIAAIAITQLEMNQQLGISNPENEGKALEQVSSQIALMSHTIDDFRNFFKTDKTLESVQCDAIIDEVVALAQGSLENGKIELVVECAAGLRLQAYPNELKQAILNIVNNAIDAINAKRAEQKRISITALQRDSDACVITICDTGGGIDEAIRERIFEPYFTTKFESQGTGIGLYLVKSIIEKNLEGAIRTYNTEMGACFEIVLTLETEATD